jgi:hypothetical protein
MVDKDAHGYADERIATPLKILIALMLVSKRLRQRPKAKNYDLIKAGNNKKYGAAYSIGEVSIH